MPLHEAQRNFDELYLVVYYSIQPSSTTRLILSPTYNFRDVASLVSAARREIHGVISETSSCLIRLSPDEEACALLADNNNF